MPGIISKFIRDQGHVLGIPALAIARSLYSAAILAYCIKAAYPAFKVRRMKTRRKEPSSEKELDEDEDTVRASHIISEKEAALKAKSEKRQRTPTVNREFFSSLNFLFRIMFPKFFCRETGILLLHTSVLVARTFLSIYVAVLEGRMVKYIVRKDVKKFAYMMLRWFTVAVPATFVNSAIRFLENQFSLALRGRLVTYAYHLYFKSQTYYRVSNLDSRLENADHCLTDDVSDFTAAVAHLYSHMSKPFLDSIMFSVQLLRLGRKQKSGSNAGIFITTSVIAITALILRATSPRFGKLVAEEASRKGYLRHIHSRIITNAEEIAFYGGQDIELSALQKAYRALVRQSKSILRQKLWYVMLEQFLMKYGWAGSGMVVISIPILTSTGEVKEGDEGNSVSTRTAYYSTAKNLMVAGADAMERLMTAYKEMVELAGYTSRVATMIKVFEECSVGKFKKNVVTTTKAIKFEDEKFSDVEFIDGIPVIKGEVTEASDGTISLEKVPIVTPNCDVVVPSLSLQVEPGMHLLISGPNGCGKSSLFRIISGLWPVYGGKLVKPPSNALFYIPQRPYMSVGCLRDQVIYPDSLQDMHERGLTDEDLERILDIVNLRHIVTREGGWGVMGDWKDILSGGEKQRMGMARVFYHQPQFALLDECTSAVSIDVEGKMYQTAKDQGITLMTITHRPSLWKFHTHILQFDGEGGWHLDALDSGTLLSLNEEKQKLEQELAGVAKKEERYKEVCLLLGEGTANDQDLSESLTE